jgi:hypothetical protein
MRHAGPDGTGHEGNAVHASQTLFFSFQRYPAPACLVYIRGKGWRFIQSREKTGAENIFEEARGDIHRHRHHEMQTIHGELNDVLFIPTWWCYCT